LYRFVAFKGRNIIKESIIPLTMKKGVSFLLLIFIKSSLNRLLSLTS